MGWKILLDKNIVKTEPTSKAEMDDLRSIVTRSLQDVAVPGLSNDARFVMAYDAARSLSKMLVRASGYRPASIGGHYNIFRALAEVDTAFRELSEYFDSCRITRNRCEYDYAWGTSETDAESLLETVQNFAIEADSWLKAHHPHLI